MKRSMFFVVMCASGMETPPDSIQLMLLKLAQKQEEQKKETDTLKNLLEQQRADLIAVKELLLHDSDSAKRKKTEEAGDKTSQLLKDMQVLTQEYNIHNKTLQNLESSCAKVLSKRTSNHGALLKRLEEEVKQLNASHKELSEGINASQYAVTTCKGLIENQSIILDNLAQQMNLHIGCLGSIITILQSVDSASADIKTRLESLPALHLVQELPQPEVALGPAQIMRDFVEPQT